MEPPALPPESAVHPLRVVIAVVAAFATGVLVALQTRINGDLGHRLGDGFVAAAISFGSGFVVLAVACLFWPRGRRGVVRVLQAIRTGRIPWWYAVGGAAGGLFVLSQGLVAALLGVALFTVGIVAGQTTSSLLIDRRGLGTMPARRVTPQRLIGALLAIAAVAVAGVGDLRASAPLWVLLLPVLVGLAVGWQQAVNGQIRHVADSAFTATLGNFFVGAVILGLAVLVDVLIVGPPRHFPTEPWLYLGGLVGVAFIAAQSVIVRTLGVLVMGLALLAGQLAAAVAFDVLVPLPGERIGPLTVAGAALTLVAVIVAAVRPRAVRAN